jgi:hypothetical protein
LEGRETGGFGLQNQAVEIEECGTHGRGSYLGGSFDRRNPGARQRANPTEIFGSSATGVSAAPQNA